MSKKKHRLELSAWLTILGVCLLFSMAVVVTLLAPSHIDPSWKSPSSTYQVQMYEVSDPGVYVSTANPGGWGLQYVYHLQKNHSLLAFQESEGVRIIASEELAPYVTRMGEEPLLTSRLLLLRTPAAEKERAEQQLLQKEWKKENPDWEKEEKSLPRFEVRELYDPNQDEAFAVSTAGEILQNWAEDPTILGEVPSYAQAGGAIYILNPREYRISEVNRLGKLVWLYNENGRAIEGIEELTKGRMHFISRKDLIELGEDIYRVEGCWYCHTDQTRTLVQDTVLNGAADYPAPPSSANEYIYGRVTFPGTRRIGPDLSRVGIKRPHRDWHMAHFWAPKTQSRGTIMPSFKHFFDNDPSGTLDSPFGLPNYKFEAIYQYLMTKGTRILPPSKAWWLGLDPLQTIEIIEGRR